MRVEEISKYGLDLILPVSLIILAEMLIFFGHMKAALAIHSLNLMLLILSSIYIENRIYPCTHAPAPLQALKHCHASLLPADPLLLPSGLCAHVPAHLLHPEGADVQLVGGRDNR